MNLGAALVLAATQLLSPQLGFVGTGVGPSGGRPTQLLTTTDFAHFRAIGPRVARDTVVDDVFFLDRLHGWIVVWNIDTVRARLYRTSDGGRTWRSVEVASHGVHAGASDTIQFINRRLGWLVVQEPTAPFALLFATRDGGVTWHAAGGRLLQVAPVRFQTARIAWQAGGFFSPALLRSADGGRSWRRVPLPTPLAERGAKASYALPGFFGSEVLAPVTYLRRGRAEVVVFRSRNGGRSWTTGPSQRVPAVPTNCTQPAYAVAFATPTAWWLGAGRRVYRTVDAGQHWGSSTFGKLGPRYRCATPAVQAATAETAWAIWGGQLLATRNGGSRWTRLRP